MDEDKHTRAEVAERWPHLRPYLRVTALGEVDYDYFHWMRVEDSLGPAERVAGYREWADFFEWHFEQRAAELSRDPVKRYLVARWTDDMAYCCRRCSTWAGGTDPGEWVPLWVRRPDLDAPREPAVLCAVG